MSLKHSCFISYRRRPQEKELAELLASCLREEVAMLLSGAGTVFRDDDCIKVGDMLDASLAEALCQSACLLLIYTPTTFEPGSAYCAREYSAMKRLERTRIKHLGGALRPERGPILVLPYRGRPNELPDELAERSPYSYNGVRQDLKQSAIFSTVVPLIARDICDWYKLMMNKGVPEGDGAPCSQFPLPDENEKTVRDLLAHTGRQFPVNPMRRA